MKMPVHLTRGAARSAVIRQMRSKIFLFSSDFSTFEPEAHTNAFKAIGILEAITLRFENKNPPEPARAGLSRAYRLIFFESLTSKDRPVARPSTKSCTVRLLD
jgi:hypothetical protein